MSERLPIWDYPEDVDFVAAKDIHEDINHGFDCTLERVWYSRSDEGIVCGCGDFEVRELVKFDPATMLDFVCRDLFERVSEDEDLYFDDLSYKPTVPELPSSLVDELRKWLGSIDTMRLVEGDRRWIVKWEQEWSSDFGCVCQGGQYV